ncbi:hypothetical protein Dimus_007543, partial [Dionaea muscipula]
PSLYYFITIHAASFFTPSSSAFLSSSIIIIKIPVLFLLAQPRTTSPSPSPTVAVLNHHLAHAISAASITREGRRHSAAAIDNHPTSTTTHPHFTSTTGEKGNTTTTLLLHRHRRRGRRRALPSPPIAGKTSTQTPVDYSSPPPRRARLSTATRATEDNAAHATAQPAVHQPPHADAVRRPLLPSRTTGREEHQ